MERVCVSAQAQVDVALVPSPSATSVTGAFFVTMSVDEPGTAVVLSVTDANPTALTQSQVTQSQTAQRYWDTDLPSLPHWVELACCDQSMHVAGLLCQRRIFPQMNRGLWLGINVEKLQPEIFFTPLVVWVTVSIPQFFP